MKQIREIFQYLNESKKYIYIITFLFFLSFFIGNFFPILFLEEMDFVIDRVFEKWDGYSDTFLGLSWNIFWNNISIDFMVLILGFTIIIPLFVVLFNGYTIGFMFDLANKPLYYFILLLPHGVFELTSFFIALGIGLKLGFVLISSVRLEFSDILRNIKFHLPLMIKTFVFVCLPLTFIGAIIETISVLYF